MDNSKIKNIILIILLVVNIILAATIGMDRLKNDELRRAAMAEAAEIMASRGIALSDNIGLMDTVLNVCSVERDYAMEKKHVSAVLGAVTVEAQGGSNIMLYQSEKGQAEFSGTGVFKILMNADEVPTGADPEETARSFLKKLGIQAVKDKDSTEVQVQDGAGTVVLSCRSGKTEIINCDITFTFTNGSLMLVTGTRPLDEVSVDDSQSELTLTTIMMRFLDIINESGHVCSELKDAELCYMQDASASGTGTLMPVWRLITDTGELYINGLTGKQETGT